MGTDLHDVRARLTFFARREFAVKRPVGICPQMLSFEEVCVGIFDRHDHFARWRKGVSILGLFANDSLKVNLVTGTISWVLAVLLALPLSRLLVSFVASAFLHGPMSYAFAPGAAIALLPLLLILTLVASLPPAMRASRLTVHDVLAYY